MNAMNARKTGLTATLTMMLATIGCGSSDDPNPVVLDTGLFDSAGDLQDAPRDGGSDATTDSTKADATDATDASDGGDAPIDGGTAADCLSTTDFDTFFTLGDASKCVVAQYTVDATFLSSLTWGRDGGPLGFDGSDATAPKLVRYAVPTGATGVLVRTTTPITVTSIPSGVYFGSQALDLPFFGWTAISYSATGAGFPGELLLVGDTSHAIDAR